MKAASTEHIVATHYTLTHKIGSGAMGDVYLAKDQRLDRDVALKLLKVNGNTPEEQAQYIQRFQQESKTIARLHHPNIVSLFDIGVDDEQFYMVMEYVHGRNLQEIIESQKAFFPIDNILRIAIQLCEALKVAHEHDIIHRDIKPANILLSTQGQVKLTDFGIARFNEAQDMRLTQAGSMMGSFLYAAPEQLTNAASVDSRADIYGAGSTLYELLTGKPVYDADNMGKLVQMVFTQEPIPPHDINPDIPEELSEIILHMLEKHVDQRYQSMDKVLGDLYMLKGTSAPNLQLPEVYSTSPRSASHSPHSEFKDTRTSQLRLSLLKTTQSGLGSILKHLRGDHAWLSLMLQKYPGTPGQSTYEGIQQRLKQPDIQGHLFSGILALQDNWVFVRNGQISGALNTAESLVDDDALARLSPSSAVQYTYALPNPLVKTLASFVANSGTPVQEGMDSAVVNLYPIIEDLQSETEKFSGYVVCHYFSESQLSKEDQDPAESHMFLYAEGQLAFSFALDQSQQLLDTHQSIQDVLNKGRCMLSIYMPEQQLLGTVIRDFWSMTQLYVDYKDPHDGTLGDALLLDAGEMSHCLSEAIGDNLAFQLKTKTGEALPPVIVEKLLSAHEYKAAHWILSEFFFGINALKQVSAFKELYPKLPHVDYLGCQETLKNEFDCDIAYDLVAYRAGKPLFVVRIGDGDPVDIDLFIEETLSVKKQQESLGQEQLLAAFYFSKTALTNQASAIFAKSTQKLGLFNKQKGWVKANKSGFHLFLSEITKDKPPRLVLPSMM
jgi:serine/threonine protein kinase